MAHNNSWQIGSSTGQESYFDGYDSLPPASSEYPPNATQGYAYSPQTPSKGDSCSQYYGPSSPSPSGQSAQSSRSRFSTWFRSRSGSPGDTEGKDRRRSRSRSKTPTEGFVVRSVVKQAGGVSASNIAEMGCDFSLSTGGEAHSSYQRSKSRPLRVAGGGTAMSLGVPPGGPGGGTGYGTAQSSNDGRPECTSQEGVTPVPSTSGSSQAAPGFPPQPVAICLSPGRPASPGVAKASVFHKPRRLSASPVTPAWRDTPDASAGYKRHTSPIGERFNPNKIQVSPDTRQELPSNGDGANAYLHDSTFRPSASAHEIPGFDPSVFAHEFEAPASQISFAATPTTLQQAPAGPEAFCSWNVTSSAAVESDHVRSSDALASPPSPLRFLATSKTSTARPPSPSNAIPPATGPGLASKLRGFFNSRPRLAYEDDEDYYGAGSNDEEDEGRRGTPYGVSPHVLLSAKRDSAQAPLSASPHTHCKMDAADREAEEMRRQTQIEAVKLIDGERRRAMETSASLIQSSPHRDRQERAADPTLSHKEEAVPSLPSSLARALHEEGWTSDALSQLTEVGRRDLVRRLTAKGKARSFQSSSQSEDQVEDIPGSNALRQTDDEEEIRWEHLTPAQRIIAETRAGHLAEPQQLVAQGTDSPMEVCEVGKEAFEVPVRRSTRSRSPRKKALQVHEVSCSIELQPVSTSTAAEAVPSSRAYVTQQTSLQAGNTGTGRATTTTSNKVGISPGNGPLPSEMNLMDGLEEMMVRFYRFERYAVPLLRALDGRVGGIEKDAMMSLHSSPTRPGDTDVDRWVGEMTRLMKHEINQLKAASKELKEGRHILSSILDAERAKAKAASQMKTAGAAIASQSPNKLEVAQHPSTLRSLSPSRMQSGSVLTSKSETSRSPAGAGRPKYTSALGKPLADGKVAFSASDERCLGSATVPPATSTQELIVLQRAQSTAATVGPYPEMRATTLVPPTADASFSIDAADEDEEDDAHRGKDETSERQPMASDNPAESFSIEAADDEDSQEAEASAENVQTSSQKLSHQHDRMLSPVVKLAPGSRGKNTSANDRLNGSIPGLTTHTAPTLGAQVTSEVPLCDYNSTQGLRSKAPSVSSTRTVTAHEARKPPGQCPTVAAVHNSVSPSLQPSSRNITSSLAPPATSTPLTLLGGRTSPSPGGLIATRNLESRRKTSPAAPIASSVHTPRSTPNGSPKLIPDVKGADIRVRGLHVNSGGSAPSSRSAAGSGLQARAQTYLQSIANTGGPSALSTAQYQPDSSTSTRPSSPRKGENLPDFSPCVIDISIPDPRSTFSTAIIPSQNLGGSKNAFKSRGGGTGMTLKERVAFFEVSANRP